ncbi:MAG: hypothetical protein AAF602_20540, partial [Myxococcota bacterium]
VALGLEGGQLGLGIAGAVGADTFGLLHAQWGVDARSHQLRTGPTVEVAAGALRQTASRAADPDWGAWFGEQSADRATTVPVGRTLLGWSAEVPLSGPLGLLGFAGAGASVYGGRTPLVQPALQARVGLSFHRGDR